VTCKVSPPWKIISGVKTQATSVFSMSKQRQDGQPTGTAHKAPTIVPMPARGTGRPTELSLIQTCLAKSSSVHLPFTSNHPEEWYLLPKLPLIERKAIQKSCTAAHTYPQNSGRRHTAQGWATLSPQPAAWLSQHVR
jgi:hypothetical protein